MRLHEFFYLTNNYEELVRYLYEHNLIRRTIKCLQCKKTLEIDYGNITLFHCTGHYYKVIRRRKKQNKTCNFQLSPFNGTLFSRPLTSPLTTKRESRCFTKIQLTYTSLQKIHAVRFQCFRINQISTLKCVG